MEFQFLIEKIKTDLNNLNKIYTILFSVFIATIPFTEHFIAIPNIVLSVLAVFFFFVIRKSHFKNINFKIIWPFLALMFISLMGILIYGRWEDFDFLTRMIFVPVILLLSLPVYKKTPMYSFIVSSASLLLISVFKLTQNYLNSNSLRLDVGGEVNRLLMGERPYLGFTYLVSFCLCLFLAKSHSNKIVRTVLYFGAIVFCLFILFISARLSILSLLIIIFISVFYTKAKIKTLLISIGGIFVLGVVAVSNPTFISRLTAGFAQEKPDVHKIIVMEPRSHIWECSTQIGQFGKVPLLGFGFRNTIEKLTECYATHDKFLNEPHRQFFIDSRFNTHNQFLNFYLSSGLFSLLLFLLFFIMVFRNSYQNYTTMALVLAVFLFCIFENVLSRQLGAMLFSTAFSFVLLIKKSNYFIQEADNQAALN